MRPSGTRWVEHQLDNLASHNHSLPILMGFFNQQIIGPHNDSIRKIKDTFIGHKNDATNLDYIFFNGAKEDILGILRPLSKLFQENALLLPSLLTNISRTLCTMTKFQKLFNDEGQEALKREDVFPSLAKLLKMISPVKGVIPERQTRSQAANFGRDFVWFHSYLLEGNIENSMKSRQWNHENCTTIKDQIRKSS